MWTKTAKKFRRNKSKACEADMNICKNNSLPVDCGEGFNTIEKTPSADDVGMIDAQPDVCKNNSSSTDSQLTMSHGPSASSEEECYDISHMPSNPSDEFESDDEGDDGEQHEVVENISDEEEVADEVNDQFITDETPSIDCKPTSEVSAESDDTHAKDIAKCTRICQSFERMLLERVNSINQIKMILREEIKMDSGKSSSLV
eukprot:scaffold7126_cov142-Skeletonema_menzelii.AAC.5